MKNFKLLLASTAILSTGALLANATDSIPGDSANVGINAELVEVRAIKTISDLSFGRVAFINYSDESAVTFLEIKIDEDGLTKVNGLYTRAGDSNGEAYVLQQGTRGVVKGATCDQLIYPGKESDGDVDIRMTSIPSGSDSEGNSSVGILECKTVSNTSVFYGTFATDSVAPGTYSGSFTVTLIANEG